MYIYTGDYLVSIGTNPYEIQPLCRILRRRSCKDRHDLSCREFPCITHYASTTRNIRRFHRSIDRYFSFNYHTNRHVFLCFSSSRLFDTAIIDRRQASFKEKPLIGLFLLSNCSQ